MPFRKIEESDQWSHQKPCVHPEHEPPQYIVLEDGTYEYRCPACGQTRIIHVNRPTFMEAV